MYNQRKRPLCELRREALGALRGHWFVTVVAMLLAAVFGAYYSGGLPVLTTLLSLELEPIQEILLQGVQAVVQGIQAILEQMESFLPSTWNLMLLLDQWSAEDIAEGLSFLSIVFACSALLQLFWYLVGTTVRIGLLRFRLQLNDGEKVTVGVLFSGFGQVFWKALFLRIVRQVILTLWSLLLLIPGIIAAYRYAMTDYILAENPATTLGDALRESARMMRGQKWRLFCLQLSFIGWFLVGILSAGIGYLWISPYWHQAKTAFYHEVSGRADIRETVVGMKDLMEQL